MILHVPRVLELLQVFFELNVFLCQPDLLNGFGYDLANRVDAIGLRNVMVGAFFHGFNG